MNIGQWLQTAQQRLKQAGIETARLDSLVLLEDCLKKDRASLLAHPEIELLPEQITGLDNQLARRETHEPLAYIRQVSEFYGRNFYVDSRVLEPRPESETIISLLIALATGEETIIDVGTGSGMLAITAKLELPKAQVMAIDISTECLEVAAQNAATYHTDITFLQGDLLAPLELLPCTPARTILLCNLPYVPDEFAINDAARHEPSLALFGGPDGLDVYRSLFDQTASLAHIPDTILAESLPSQHAALKTIAQAHGYFLKQTDDFIQVFTQH